MTGPRLDLSENAHYNNENENNGFNMIKVRTKRLQTAKAYLANCLASVENGEMLPPIRDLIEGSGTTRAAVYQAIAYYRERGLLESRPRIGLFKTGNDNSARIIDLIACNDTGYSNDPSGLIFDVLGRFHKVAAAHGYAVRLHSVPQEESIEKYTLLSRLPDSSGFVLILANIRELVSAFQATGKPTVCLLPHGKFIDVDQVVDARSIVDLQMAHLIELGHRRILYLREEYPFYQNSTMLNRRMQYYQAMARHGFKVYPHWQDNFVRGDLGKALQSAFSRNPVPTALIVYDTDLPEVYRFLESRRLKIGSDVSVIATDGSAAINRLTPSATSVVSHSLHAVETIWELLEKQRRGDLNPKTVEVLLTFKKGRSTGKAPKSSSK